MTWSIIARDPSTGQIGIAVATRFFAVGARVPHIVAGVGGIATQALVNPYYGIDGVKLLAEGREPNDILKTLIAGDDGRESRQLQLIGSTYTVARCTREPLRGIADRTSDPDEFPPEFLASAVPSTWRNGSARPGLWWQAPATRSS